MKIFAPWYLRSTRKRFFKDFHPAVLKKRENYLVSVPRGAVDLVAALPVIAGLHKTSRIIAFAPRQLHHILHACREGLFETQYYDEPPTVLTREFKTWQQTFSEESLFGLIEFNTPPNLSLPYLAAIEKRISFYDPDAYPYYNVMLKGGPDVLAEFLLIKSAAPEDIFHLTKTEVKEWERQLPQSRPIAFLNGCPPPPGWSGAVITLTETGDFARAVRAIYLCDVYHGKDDEHAALARLFRKPITIP